MSSGVSAKRAISRIGQRRQIVIPKRVFEALKLQPGDFLEVSAEGGRLHMLPKCLVDIREDSLTSNDAEKVRHGEAEIKAGRSRSWRTVRNDLGR
jgi:AbrB family looped-hinge helix DNA binding protein